jgi:hypothetical protein
LENFDLPTSAALNYAIFNYATFNYSIIWDYTITKFLGCLQLAKYFLHFFRWIQLLVAFDLQE